LRSNRKPKPKLIVPFSMSWRGGFGKRLSFLERFDRLVVEELRPDGCASATLLSRPSA
jgi:hypothetical protein